jgi:FkbM family methyltransferase
VETRTKHYFQKLFVRKLVGQKLYSKIKFLKIYFKAKIGSGYEITGILMDILKNDDVFFDVGANLGQYIIRIKSKFKNGVKIYAFEPVLNNYNILSDHVSKNYKDVEIEKYAVSDEDGLDILYIPLIDDIEIDTQASIDYENRKMYYSKFMEQEIQKITIDNYVSAKNICRMDFLKVDTEGNDERVIKGGLKSINKFKPIIFCEDMESQETLAILNKLGYSRYLMNTNYKLSVFSEAKSEGYFKDLVIFIPEEKLNIFVNHIVE